MIIGTERGKRFDLDCWWNEYFVQVELECTCTIYKAREVLCIDIYVLGMCGRWFYVSIADLKYGVRFLHIPW